MADDAIIGGSSDTHHGPADSDALATASGAAINPVVADGASASSASAAQSGGSLDGAPAVPSRPGGTAYDVASRQVFGPPTRPLVACCPCGTTSGNTITFYRSPRTANMFPWMCLLGPDWPCMLVTYALLTGPSLAFLVLVAPTLHPAVIAVGVVLMLAAVGTFTVTACSNPGYLPKQTPDEMEQQRLRMEEEGMVGQFTVCQYCNVIRVEKTTHCYDCNSCVLELDHHCPWTGKCIGKYNLNWFYAFLATMLTLIVYVAACMFAWIVERATGAMPQ